MKIKINPTILPLIAILLGACASNPGDVPTQDVLATAAAKEVELQLTLEAIQAAQTQLAGQELVAQEEAAPTEEIAVQDKPTEVIETSTPAPPPTAVLVKRDRILMYAPDTCRDSTYTQLEGLAFTDGIKFNLYDNSGPGRYNNDFLNELKSPDVAAGIWLNSYITDADLITLKDFIDDGGKLFLAYGDWWTVHNELLQDLFGVSIVKEEVLGNDHGGHASIQYQSILPSWANKMSVYVADENGYNTLSLTSYLMTIIQGGEKAKFSSEASGDQVLMYLSNAEGSVIFWPHVHYYKYGSARSCSTYIDFFEDKQIDYQENEQAALAMLNYLLGR